MDKHSLDFVNRECKDSSHDKCHGSWQGLGYEVICSCVCHYQEGISTDIENVNKKGTGRPAQHQRSEPFSSHPCNPCKISIEGVS
jgi:hypothetical protein